MEASCNGKYKSGETAYIVENGWNIRTVMVLSESGGLYKVRFREGGGTCLKAGRLFKTAEDAKQAVTVKEKTVRGPRSPHSFGYW
ncbi:MAG: hypothetical protein IJ106_04570 [Parasporobacterium sp.]|nr:hypothetical protein [Parasporobacterium sp.]